MEDYYDDLDEIQKQLDEENEILKGNLDKSWYQMYIERLEREEA